jgi:MFS family permease
MPPALQHRDFRVFWTGALFSAVGTQMTTVAMAWQIYELTGSALQVGLLGLGRAIPQIGFAVFGGLIADAMDRKRLMIVLQVMQCGVSTALALLTLTGAISPGALFICAVLFAFSSAMETPIRQAVVPNLVPRSEIGSAVALSTMERSLGLIIGPGIAGVMIAVSGPGLCYAADAASWLIMLATLALIRAPLQVSIAGRVSLQALAMGLRFVSRQPVILPFMILDFGATLFGSSYALLPIYAKDILEVGPIGLGALYAAPSVGGVIMGVALSGPLRIDRAGRWVLFGVAFYGVCTMAFAVSTVLWVSVLALAGTGAGNIVSAVLRGTSNQLLTPDELRGRVAAVNSAFVTGGPQLGQFESGVVAAIGGTELSALTGGVGALALAGGMWLLPKVRAFRLSSVTAPAPEGSLRNQASRG